MTTTDVSTPTTPSAAETDAVLASVGPFTAELLEATRSILDAQLEHPFVKGLGDGSLEVARFSNWVRQDYLYLKEYSRIFAWGVAKALDLETMAWYARVLDLTLNVEMGLHRGYAERFGITLAELEAEPIWPTARAYTDFLVRTAADGDLADLSAALLPCAWGYAWVGHHLARTASPDDPRYADWIAMYSSEEFGGAVQWLKQTMETLAEGASDAKRAHLVEIFVTSTRYEWMFWEMCYHGERWPV